MQVYKMNTELWVVLRITKGLSDMNCELVIRKRIP